MKTLLNVLLLSATLISFTACSDQDILNEIQAENSIELRPDGMVESTEVIEVTRETPSTNKPDGFQQGVSIQIDRTRDADPTRPDGGGRADMEEMQTDHGSMLRSNGDTHPGKDIKTRETPSKD